VTAAVSDEKHPAGQDKRQTIGNINNAVVFNDHGQDKYRRHEYKQDKSAQKKYRHRAIHAQINFC
jgi:hypothetical protein